jgi:prepilin-type N-terminal cleavage/methylation domain-containing protein/prepilin-type processing-associated H-X9-DG protein
MNVIDGEMRFSCNKKLSRAFTLVELLVVISVIGLLMGILVPALGKARKTANRTYCKANLRQIGVAIRSYLDDNRDIFPLCSAMPWEITDTNSPFYAPPITKVLGPILKEPKVFICKSDNTQKYYLRTGNTSYWYSGVTMAGPPGLAGRTIKENFLVVRGAKEKDIPVMNDFDDYHPISGRKGNSNYVIGINYLYADWHVSDIKKQE